MRTITETTWDDLQYTNQEDARESDFPVLRHLQSPDPSKRHEEYAEVRYQVEHSGQYNGQWPVDAIPFHQRIIRPLYWSTLEDGNKKRGDKKRHVARKEGQHQVESFARVIGDEDAYVLQQDRQLRREDNHGIEDFDDEAELCRRM